VFDSNGQIGDFTPCYLAYPHLGHVLPSPFVNSAIANKYYPLTLFHHILTLQANGVGEHARIFKLLCYFINNLFSFY